jgi:plastocyanin
MNSRIFLFAAYVIISFGLIAGCSSSQNSTNGMTFTRAANGITVNVTEDEYHLHMPVSFPGGVVTFHITNNGDHNHNFKIEGMGIKQQLPTDLLPGTTADMTVSLVPGTYDVDCPIIGHSMLGMRLSVTVTQ